MPVTDRVLKAVSGLETVEGELSRVRVRSASRKEL